MKAPLSIVATLAAALLFSGCGSQGQPATPHLKVVSPSATERGWLKGLNLAVSSPAASTPAAERRAGAIQRLARVPGVETVRLKIYKTPALTTSLVLAVSRPAYFLRHQLKPILPQLTANGHATAYYLRIVDDHGKTVLEWSGRPERSSSGGAFFHGSLYVRPGLERCSPIVAVGWPMRLPPCPSK
ncbi:MAG: hypothetical protein ABSC36_05775 [Gaiellaceae bacterium]|jgi:hypothetical protein